jgi:hypothetical protein
MMDCIAEHRNGAVAVLHSQMPEDPKPGTTYILQPDEEDEVDSTALGAGGNLYLMVFNPSKDTKGKYPCEAYNL